MNKIMGEERKKERKRLWKKKKMPWRVLRVNRKKERKKERKKGRKKEKKKNNLMVKVNLKVERKKGKKAKHFCDG